LYVAPTMKPGRAEELAPAAVAARVLVFYRERRRALPWRQTSDPYAIWVSEIMLQQTRVATAKPYYERWMARFPTVTALAEAPLDDVLAAWSGLGYYRRARNLHRGAREVVARYGGQVPGSAEELRALPGVGRYTAGAIASVAFGERAPIVDGNVARVLARLYAIEDDIKGTATSRRLWSLATELVPAEAPGDFNQGLMELGATICTPTNPSCETCPLALLCRGRARGLERELPRTPRRKRAAELPLLALSAAWLERDGRVVLARRPAEGLFGGLWELPLASGGPGELAALLGDAAALRGGAPVARHHQVLSHRRLKLEVFEAEPRMTLDTLATRLASRYDRVAWHAIDAVRAAGIASATSAICCLYQEHAGWNRNKPPSATSKRGIKKSSRGFASSASTPTTTRTSKAPPGGRPRASPS
jgi:A/G-specific adenine glycosylase